MIDEAPHFFTQQQNYCKETTFEVELKKIGDAVPLEKNIRFLLVMHGNLMQIKLSIMNNG